MAILSNRSALACAALVAGSIVLHGWMSRATPNGPTKDALSFGGTLTQNGKPLTGQQTVTFAFKKNGATICSPQSTVTPDSTSGAFNAQIDVASCPSAALFDGGDVVLDVSVGGNVIASNQPINPVPYAKYADRVGVAECPVGYGRDAAQMGMVLCKKGADEVVRVGTGASAFWIDRYEASLWQKPDGGGSQYGLADGDAAAAGFALNGQWTTPAYAVSKAGVTPAAYVTWFQANEACRLSGKRLPLDDEWQSAARGTIDPGASDGTNGACVTSGSLRPTGGGAQCQSAWGAQDMVGNLEEILAVPNKGGLDVNASATWPNNAGTDYRGDRVVGVTSFVDVYGTGQTNGLPSMTARGGLAGDGAKAGVFSLDASHALSSLQPSIGFRCVIPR